MNSYIAIGFIVAVDMNDRCKICGARGSEGSVTDMLCHWVSS